MANSTIAATGMRSRRNGRSAFSMSWRPDLRGHGDFEWAKGSSYSLSDNVYDLGRLMRHAELEGAGIVGHSMGGMVALTYAGTCPEQVSRLVVLDGAFLSRSQPAPIASSRCHDGSIRSTASPSYAPSAFRTIEEAAQRLSARNRRLTLGAGASSCPPRCPAGRRRPLSLEVRSLPAGEGAVSAVAGRLRRLVVAHYLSEPC